jgi:3-dehydroquinate dehydratase II
MKIQIINGPNLNLTGIREQAIYGSVSFDEYLIRLKQIFLHHKILYYQSNVEGELINKLHEVGFDVDGIALNAGAYTHTSVAIGDAVKAIKAPVVEVHLSNLLSREAFRHISYIAPNAVGSITGFGTDGYRLAVYALEQWHGKQL